MQREMYRAANLPPATYDVRAELEGFDSVVRSVMVRVGATVAVDFTLRVGSLSETVTVLGEAPIVDPERAGLSVNISNTALTSLPINANRRYTDVFALVPGANIRPEDPDAGAAVNSRYTTENLIRIDGMEGTDPFGSSVSTVSFSYDAVQDIQVKTLGGDAEDIAIGGIMNVVTKSGGNQVHGTASLFVIPQRFNGTNVQGRPANQRKDFQPDFTLGGPIARDRIWFFGAYKRAHEDQTLGNAPVPREIRGHSVLLKFFGPGQREPSCLDDDAVRPDDRAQRADKERERLARAAVGRACRIR
jgi:hypothetical protein